MSVRRLLVLPLKTQPTPKLRNLSLKPSTSEKSVQNINTSAKWLVNDIPIPPPATWSVSDLRLSGDRSSAKATPSVPYVELEILAKRSTIDLNYYREVHGENGIDSLRQGVEDMIRCLSVVTEFSNSQEVEVSHKEMYDLPEGVRIPLRPDTNLSTESQEVECLEAPANRLKESISHKLIEIKGQKYFHIDRKR
jgi:hypothetical protein